MNTAIASAKQGEYDPHIAHVEKLVQSIDALPNEAARRQTRELVMPNIPPA